MIEALTIQFPHVQALGNTHSTRYAAEESDEEAPDEMPGDPTTVPTELTTEISDAYAGFVGAKKRLREAKGARGFFRKKPSRANITVPDFAE
eukprot:15481974-Alexandrium_andersonii.AAC.1